MNNREEIISDLIETDIADSREEAEEMVEHLLDTTSTMTHEDIMAWLRTKWIAKHGDKDAKH